MNIPSSQTNLNTIPDFSNSHDLGLRKSYEIINLIVNNSDFALLDSNGQAAVISVLNELRSLFKEPQILIGHGKLFNFESDIKRKELLLGEWDSFLKSASVIYSRKFTNTEHHTETAIFIKPEAFMIPHISLNKGALYSKHGRHYSDFKGRIAPHPLPFSKTALEKLLITFINSKLQQEGLDLTTLVVRDKTSNILLPISRLVITLIHLDFSPIELLLNLKVEP